MRGQPWPATLHEGMAMTFLEKLEPLLRAAEKYAELSELRSDLPPARKLGTIVLEQKEAETALLKAAIEFAKWGK